MKRGQKEDLLCEAEKRRKDIKGRKKTAETYFYVVLHLNLGCNLCKNVFVILGTDCEDGRLVILLLCERGRKVSYLYTVGSSYVSCPPIYSEAPLVVCVERP